MRLIGILTLCLLTTVSCSRNEEEDEQGRVYCVQITRVQKRDTQAGFLHFHGEVRPVQCRAGFVFCTTDTSCCCELVPYIPPQDHQRTNYGMIAGLSISGVFLLICLASSFSMCSRSRRNRFAQSPVHEPPPSGGNNISDGRMIRNYESRYYSHPAPAAIINKSARHLEVGGASTADSFDIGKLKSGRPLSISESIPPPPYSEHSFAATPNHGPLVLLKAGNMGSEKSKRSYYTQRSARPSSVTSWLQTHDDATSRSLRSARSQPVGVRSLATSSRYGSSRAGVQRKLQGYEPDQGLRTAPSMLSSSPGSTVPASEVFYDSFAPSMLSKGGRTPKSVGSARNDDARSQAGSQVSAVSYNPTSVTAASLHSQ